MTVTSLKTRVLVGAGVMAIGLAVAAVAVGVVVVRVVHQDSGLGTFDVVATVDGEPIVYGELQQSVDAERSQVYTYFRRTYGANATNDSTFWTTEFGGETPAEKLRHSALARSVQLKLEQIAARRQGLVADISYRASVGALERVNKERRAVVDNGGVVYGPVTYDERTYFAQRQQDLRTGLEEKLGPALASSDEEVGDYYSENKQRFSLGVSRTIAAISFTATGTTAAPDAAAVRNLAAAKAELAKLEQRIVAGVPFDAIYAEVRRNGGDVLTASEHVHDYRTMRMDTLVSPSMAQVVGALDEGAVSGIVQDDRSAGIYKCAKLKLLGYMPLRQVKPRILNDLRDKKYDALVQRWRAKAEVKIVASAMGRVAVS